MFGGMFDSKKGEPGPGDEGSKYSPDWNTASKLQTKATDPALLELSKEYRNGVIEQGGSWLDVSGVAMATMLAGIGMLRQVAEREGKMAEFYVLMDGLDQTFHLGMAAVGAIPPQDNTTPTEDDLDG